MTGEEVNFVQCWNGAAVDAARIHEGEETVDLVGHFLVALAGGEATKPIPVEIWLRSA